MRNVVFLDRDGTLIVEPSDRQIDSLEKLALMPGVIGGLLDLVRHGCDLVMVSNQDGLGTESFPTASFEGPHRALLRLLGGEGIRFAEIFICPHRAADGCGCRKPAPGALGDYLARNAIDPLRSFVVGDRRSDVEFAHNIGCRAVLLSREEEPSISADCVARDFRGACEYILRAGRSARVERRTEETEIEIEVALEGRGEYSIRSGIGFFDHMLAQLARHSSIDMTIDVRGDLYVDEHHSVEDTGRALGEALRMALGDKRGIERYGFVLPMDESRAHASLDLGGRPYLVFDAGFARERVGDLPTELVEDFFRAFCDGLRAGLHIAVTGRNDHHKIEAIFKAVARALRCAVARTSCGAGLIPSTKGVL